MTKISRYKAVYFEQVYTFVENDSIRMTFVVYDENGNLISDLSSYKFKFFLEYSNDEIQKKSVGYTGGSADQIEISGSKIIVKIDVDETDGYNGEYAVELEMQKTDDTERYTVFYDTITIQEEVVDF